MPITSHFAFHFFGTLKKKARMRRKKEKEKEEGKKERSILLLKVENFAKPT